VGPNATIERVRPLAGGTHAATHLLRIANPACDTVLRRFPSGDTAAGHEAAVLTAPDGLGGWAPRLIDVDPSGEHVGEPATLITRIAGQPDIIPVDPHAAATELDRDPGLRACRTAGWARLVLRDRHTGWTEHCLTQFAPPSDVRPWSPGWCSPS
jgi:hypothetical protein